MTLDEHVEMCARFVANQEELSAAGVVTPAALGEWLESFVDGTIEADERIAIHREIVRLHKATVDNKATPERVRLALSPFVESHAVAIRELERV